MLHLEKSAVATTVKRPLPSSSSTVRRFAAVLTRLHTATNDKSTSPSVIGIIGSHRSISSPTIAAELAYAAATEVDENTLVVDMSGPGSNMCRLLDAKSHPGITDILVGDEPVDACIVNGLGGGKMSFVPWGAGNSVAMSSPETRRFVEFLEECRSRFEFVVVALPPATESSPGAALATCLDGVLLVIESEKTNVATARRSQLLLERTGARVLGAVLCNCRNYLPEWLRRK